MKIITINRDAPEISRLQECARALQDNSMAAYPTDTFYGLGGNPFARELVEKIYRVKRRSREKPLILLLGNMHQFESFTKDSPAFADRLTRVFWPGPLTLVLKASEAVPGFLQGEGETIAVRIPGCPVILELVKMCGFPLTGSSANLSGHPSPDSVQAIAPEILKQMDLVIDAGKTGTSCGSTIVDCTGDHPVVLREGVVPRESLAPGENAG